MPHRNLTPQQFDAAVSKVDTPANVNIYELFNRILAQDRKLDRLDMELQTYKDTNTKNLNDLISRHEKFEEHFEQTFDQLTASLAGIDRKLAIFIETSVQLDKFKQRTISLIVTVGIPVFSLIAFLIHNYFTHR